MESLTQKYKTSSMRTLITRALNGLPINARTQQVFDLDDCDIETDGVIFDEYADPLEVADLKITLEDDLAISKANEIKKKQEDHKSLLTELDELRKFKQNFEKGGILNEDVKTPPPSPQN